MGIHIHRAGCPPQDMCGCCDLRTRLDALYDRAHNAILSINGQTPDGQGAITLELLEQAAVQSIIDDHIDPLRETVDGLSITVESWNPLFEDYVHILRKVDIDLPDLITANHQYTAAVADDLLQNHYTKTQADGRFALQSELDTYAKDSDLVAALDAMVRRSGNSTPQVITGTGGLMLQGDLSVGGDITGSSDTYLHFDTVRQMELAGMTVRKDGAITRLANSNGLSINGLFMSDMVSTIKTELQTLRGPLAGPSATDSSPSNVYVTKANVMSTNGLVNNLVHTIGNETIQGIKTFEIPANILQRYNWNVSGNTATGVGWYALFKIKFSTRRRHIHLKITDTNSLADVFLDIGQNGESICRSVRFMHNAGSLYEDCVWCCKDNEYVTVFYKNPSYRSTRITVQSICTYSTSFGMSELDTSVFTGQYVSQPQESDYERIDKTSAFIIG